MNKQEFVIRFSFVCEHSYIWHLFVTMFICIRMISEVRPFCSLQLLYSIRGTVWYLDFLQCLYNLNIFCTCNNKILPHKKVATGTKNFFSLFLWACLALFGPVWPVWPQHLSKLWFVFVLPNSKLQFKQNRFDAPHKYAIVWFLSNYCINFY